MLELNDILDAEEVAKLLRIHRRTVIRLATLGEIPAFRIGSKWRFVRKDLDNYIDEQKRKQQRPES